MNAVLFISFLPFQNAEQTAFDDTNGMKFGERSNPVTCASLTGLVVTQGFREAACGQ